MSKMEELIDSLSSLAKTMEDLNDAAKRGKLDNLLYKKVEDGIFNNLHNASESQIKNLISSYHFKYYTEYNRDKELLKSVIKTKLRDSHIDDLLK